MSGIPAAEMAAMRADAAALVLDTTCVIYAITSGATPDAYGDSAVTETIRGTVACALAVESRASQDNAILAQRESSAAFYTLSVAYDTVIQPEDKVVSGGHTFRVITLHDNQSFKVVKRALVEEVI